MACRPKNPSGRPEGSKGGKKEQGGEKVSTVAGGSRGKKEKKRAGV